MSAETRHGIHKQLFQKDQKRKKINFWKNYKFIKNFKNKDNKNNANKVLKKDIWEELYRINIIALKTSHQ